MQCLLMPSLSGSHLRSWSSPSTRSAPPALCPPGPQQGRGQGETTGSLPGLPRLQTESLTAVVEAATGQCVLASFPGGCSVPRQALADEGSFALMFGTSSVLSCFCLLNLQTAWSERTTQPRWWVPTGMWTSLWRRRDAGFGGVSRRVGGSPRGSRAMPLLHSGAAEMSSDAPNVRPEVPLVLP